MVTDEQLRLVVAVTAAWQRVSRCVVDCCRLLAEGLCFSGLKFTRHQIIAVRRRLDKDRTGTVRTDEFLQVLGIASS